MSRNLLSTLCVALALIAAHRSVAQQDALPIGGPEDGSPYDELLRSENAEAVLSVWTAEDSARNIPAYETYGNWDTDAIFARDAAALHDTVTLCLSHSACDTYMPVCGSITSPFGPRHGRMHYGLDLDLDNGDPVVCAFDGLVRISRFHPQFGNVIVVRHANGLETLYAHLSERLVEAGDAVEAGTLIGLGGSTGRSTGDHLHFETRYLGQPIDPQFLFDVKEGELKASTLHIHAGLFAVIAKAKAELHAKNWHTVRRGDTLSAIARRYNTNVTNLRRLNRIGSGNKLRVGQRVRCR